MRLLALGVLLLAGLVCSGDAGAQAPQVSVQNAWSRATPPHASTGVIYLTLTSANDDRLIGASSPVAERAELHETTMDGGIMRMRPVEGGLDLPAGKPVTLGPGGAHIMLTGLKTPLRQGQSVPVHLMFARAAPADVQAKVQAIGATGPAAPR
ncbi:MAG: copper chaperone PCu(A)C [Acidisphaera sp.]|nr:copper chaperone PCu(A)C [Acidisphaera sp.]